MDPGLCPADGAVSPEHVAAVLGWLKVTGQSLPENWLGQFAWHENEKWFVHPDHRTVVERAGLAVESPRPATHSNSLKMLCRSTRQPDPCCSPAALAVAPRSVSSEKQPMPTL